MRYSDIEKGLVASIDENDPYKVTKQFQIKRWSHLYGNPLLESWGELKMPFFQKVLRDEECWKKVDTLEQVKLDGYVVGKKLIDLKTEDGEKNFLKNFDRYKIACWCCVEEDIRTLFEEFKSSIGNESAENLVTRLNDNALMIYWSHVMNGQEHQLKINYPDTSCHKYVHGFVGAILERSVEALEFFWNKLQSVDSVSYEQKEGLLMDAALYKGVYRAATVDTVNFCLRNLDLDKHPELLKRDFKQNGHYSTLFKLNTNYFFDSAKKLLAYLRPEDISCESYSTLIYGVLKQISSTPNNNFIKAGYDMLSIMWYAQGFEEHQQHYLHELCSGVSFESINHLTAKKEIPEILSQIVGSLTLKQVKYMQEVDEVSYIVFSERGLLNKDVVDNLSKNDETLDSGDIEKSSDLLEATNNISILGDEETEVVHL